MDPVTLTLNPLVFLAFAVGLVAGWFAGGYYKVRRTEGMTKDQIIAEAKSLTEDKAKAYFQVVLNEINKLKPPTQ